MARFTTQTVLEGCHMIMHRISGVFFLCRVHWAIEGLFSPSQVLGKVLRSP